jgi:hypothetical protein
MTVLCRRGDRRALDFFDLCLLEHLATGARAAATGRADIARMKLRLVSNTPGQLKTESIAVSASNPSAFAARLLFAGQQFQLWPA